MTSMFWAKTVSEAIGFSVFCIVCAYLEVQGNGAGKLWIVVVTWAFCYGVSLPEKKDKV